jgi:hypothetical protein
LVEATPGYIGATYLRSLYDTLGIQPDNTQPPQYARYYQKLTPSPAALDELHWWNELLTRPLQRRARSASTQLICAFGDGSGTGAGGTITFGDTKQTIAWMGVWEDVGHTSNWRELCTILTTLQQLHNNVKSTNYLKGATMIYFTDNMVAYYVCYASRSREPKLHALVRQIRLLEAQLDVLLEVVHIPGKFLIRQGTDGLSRGIWLSPNNTIGIGLTWMQQALQAVEWSCQLYNTIIQFAPANWHYFTHDSLSPSTVLHAATVWCPLPEIAQQILSLLLVWWLEAPYTTQCAVIVPRVLQRWWSKVSKHVESIELPLCTSQGIPIFLLLVTTHSLVLPPIRLDSATEPLNKEWHLQQAEAVRRVLPANIGD